MLCLGEKHSKTIEAKPQIAEIHQLNKNGINKKEK